MRIFQPKVKLGRAHYPGRISLYFKVPCGSKQVRQLFCFQPESLGNKKWPRIVFDHETADWPLLISFSLCIELKRILASSSSRNRPGSGTRKHKQETLIHG
jgi:hypothetical protein